MVQKVVASVMSNTYISKLNLAQLPQSTDDFSAYLVGDVQLGQGHIRRAEQRILGDTHAARRERRASLAGSR